MKLAAIDVHKKMLAVVIGDGVTPFERQRFGAMPHDLARLEDWLKEHEISEVVMESTAEYWKPVWNRLEKGFRLHLAQAQSNAAPPGRKHDFGDAERLLRRLNAGELRLSYVPDIEQRAWRTLVRARQQRVEQTTRLHHELECLLETVSVKLSSVVSDIFGASGRRILHRIAAGETDPVALAALGDQRLRATPAELAAALSGDWRPEQLLILQLQLEQLDLHERHIASMSKTLTELLKVHQAAIQRLTAIPGVGASGAERMEAKSFATSDALASWLGVCPGMQQSAGTNFRRRPPRGNQQLRGVLWQMAWAAVHTKDSYFQSRFQSLVPKHGAKKAVSIIVHLLVRIIWKVLHQKEEYVEKGARATNAKALLRRATRLSRELRRAGYQIAISPILSTPSSS
ncbi:MAG: IS110 family transposase [Bryobacteraceae bacterium]|nr:IS110 family transposase [Bryobacteraceae bacterium]